MGPGFCCVRGSLSGPPVGVLFVAVSDCSAVR